MPAGQQANREFINEPVTFPQDLKWRVGRSLGRTIYAQRGEWATKQDIYLGMMETPELAATVVCLYNGREEVKSGEHC